MEGSKRLRVLAADDSAVMREVLRMVFQMHGVSGDSALPAMELCGAVKDGVEALEAVRTLRPDVLLLDLEMPRLDGLGVLQELRRTTPDLPVIMCSAHTERGARATLDALSHGAKDYVMKPGQAADFASALDRLMKQLLPKIAALAGVALPVVAPRAVAIPRLRASGARVEVVVIGVSTGGPSALELMLPMLPVTLPVPVLIVQHMPKLFTGALAERLNRLSAMPVAQARDGVTISPGQILLAPGDMHMEMALGTGRTRVVKLHSGPALNSCKPSVDYLFTSAAKVCGDGVLGLMMTGMGSDGYDGAKAVVQAGGAVLAQDEASSAVWGMPGRVTKGGLAEAVVPLAGLAQAIEEHVEAGRSSAWQARERRTETTYGLL